MCCHAEQVLRCHLSKALGCGETGPSCWPGAQILERCVPGGQSEAEHTDLNPGIATEMQLVRQLVEKHGGAIAAAVEAGAEVPTDALLMDSWSTCMSSCQNAKYQLTLSEVDTSTAAFRCVDNRRMSLVSTVDVQRFLKCNGFYFGSMDGVYGIRTRTAVIAFQNLNSIKTDGVVRQDTTDAMRAYRNVEPTTCDAPDLSKSFSCPKNVKFALQSVKDHQVWLKCNGFLVTGHITGYIDGFTTRAIRTFQQAACLTVDGVVGPLTVARMREWYDGWHDPDACEKWTTTQLGDREDSYTCLDNAAYNIRPHHDVPIMKVFLRCAGFSFGAEMAGDDPYEQSFRDAMTAFQVSRSPHMCAIHDTACCAGPSWSWPCLAWRSSSSAV